MQFSSLRLSPSILKSVTAEGYTTPTPIQAQAIPPVLEGHDLLGCAQTGTGKTAAFALPILHRLMSEPADTTRRGPALPRALILAPTRELATQIAESFGVYGKHTGLTHTVVFGGVSQFHQVRALHRGVDILVATPGRLMDLMQQRVVNLTQVKILVLDEADRMLDMGFIRPIRHIAAAVPAARQTLMFSATMPKEIMHLAESLLKNPKRVAVTPVASAAPKIEQSVYMIQRDRKQTLLEVLLKDRAIERALVFTRTKHGADRVARRLHRAGVGAEAIHGNKAQNQRQRALDKFRSGISRVLVATDVAARGLDVDGITHVFNFDLPHEPESYVHRIGRTARAGASGIAISFCAGEERDLLRSIEKLTGKRVAAATLPELPAHVPSAEPEEEHRERPAHRGERRGKPGQGARPAHGPAPHAHAGPRPVGALASRPTRTWTKGAPRRQPRR
ncbi:ATP-dependent RNA helicase RhlE [Phycisphaerales bacterium]|nr:ATP-dependent RNA helicase RhlE [Phycisphaerales bacterium]